MKMILHPLISQYARQQHACLISSPKMPKPQHFFHLKHSLKYLLGASYCSRDRKKKKSASHTDMNTQMLIILPFVQYIQSQVVSAKVRTRVSFLVQFN